MVARVASLLVLVACSSSPKPAAPPPVAPAPAPPSAPPQVAPAQLFADTDQGFAFVDPDRRTKLTAALGTLDAAIADEMKKQALPGLAVGVVIDGELAYAKGFGVVDPATKVVPDADTVYRIGSISKSFTGLAILALRDDGALGLDDPLVRWIPEAAGLIYPSRDARPVTLRQVLSHTSGLTRMGPFDPDHGPDEATVVKSLARLPLETAPGTVHSYSNLGFSLLGIVAAHAARRPFHDFVASRILGPLGMTSTYWDAAAVPKGKLAPAFERAPGDPKPAEPIRLGAADGAGGIYSTVRDLARYAALQLSAYPPRSAADDGPVRRATLREAHSTGVLINGSARPRLASKPGEPIVDLHADSYGFGWVSGRTCELDDLVWHGGAIDSYRADLRFLTSRGVGVVVLTNFGTANTPAIGERVVAELVKTGALARRVARPGPAFGGALKELVAVLNNWDEAAYKAMLDPKRPPQVDVEKEELATYKELHGACTAGPAVDVRGALGARFKLACERGAFVMELILSPAGKITGFIGESRDVPAPPAVTKVGTALAALTRAWNARAYAAALPRALVDAARAKTIFDDLRAQHGVCTVRAPVHNGTDWELELACERGGDMVLGLGLDPKDKAIVGFNLRPVPQPDMRCATR